MAFRPWLEATLRADDMAMGLDRPKAEMVEMLYHVLWETVHVFLEHRELELPTTNVSIIGPKRSLRQWASHIRRTSEASSQAA